jgi:hypothetical protein
MGRVSPRRRPHDTAQHTDPFSSLLGSGENGLAYAPWSPSLNDVMQGCASWDIVRPLRLLCNGTGVPKGKMQAPSMKLTRPCPREVLRYTGPIRT